MWIRSQDKKRLVVCKELSVQCLNEHVSDTVLKILDSQRIWGVKNKYYVLGTYSTEEKALKVLDMIHKYIKNEKIFIDNFGDRNVAYGKYVVFEMPQDEEVE